MKLAARTPLHPIMTDVYLPNKERPDPRSGRAGDIVISSNAT